MSNSVNSTSIEPVIAASYQNSNEWRSFNSPKGAIGGNGFITKAFNDHPVKRGAEKAPLRSIFTKKSVEVDASSSNKFNIRTIESPLNRVIPSNSKLSTETNATTQMTGRQSELSKLNTYSRSPSEEPHSAGSDDRTKFEFRKNIRIETEGIADQITTSKARAFSTKAMKSVHPYRNFVSISPSNQLQNNQAIEKLAPVLTSNGGSIEVSTLENKPSMFQNKKKTALKNETESSNASPSQSKRSITILNKIFSEVPDKSNLRKGGNQAMTFNTTNNSQPIFPTRKPQLNNFIQSSRQQEQNKLDSKLQDEDLKRKIHYLQNDSLDELEASEYGKIDLRNSASGAGDLKEALRQTLVSKRNESDKTTELSKNLVYMRKSESTRSVNTSSKIFTTNTTKPPSKPKQEESAGSVLDGFVTRVSQGDSVLGNMQKQVQKEEQSDEPLTKPRLLRNEPGSPTPKTNTTKALVKQVSLAQDRTTVMFPNRRLIKGNTDKISSSQEMKPTPKLELIKQPSFTKLPFTYYVSNLYKYHKNPGSDDYLAELYREHFIQTYQALQFCKTLKPSDLKIVAMKKVSLWKRDTHKDKKTLIFDLDETLIHCNESTDLPYDVKLPIKFPTGEFVEAGINIRPYAVEILKEMSTLFEIIVFTASHSCYANVVLDYLDPKKQYIHHRLFRENCIATPEGIHIKDLRIFVNRDPNDLILVDNAAYSFGMQIDNGVPIIPYYNNKEDQELKMLMPFLRTLAEAEDSREIIRQTFKFDLYTKCKSPREVLEKLVLTK